MKNSFVFIIGFMITTHAAQVLGQAGMEQYYYWEKEKIFTPVTIVHIQAYKNWYVEARYNYEERASFSLYGGKMFTGGKRQFSYSLKPIAGAVMGKLSAASIG